MRVMATAGPRAADSQGGAGASSDVAPGGQRTIIPPGSNDAIAGRSRCEPSGPVSASRNVDPPLGCNTTGRIRSVAARPETPERSPDDK